MFNILIGQHFFDKIIVVLLILKDILNANLIRFIFGLVLLRYFAILFGKYYDFFALN